jgi:hypothetical protein
MSRTNRYSTTISTVTPRACARVAPAGVEADLGRYGRRAVYKIQPKLIIKPIYMYTNPMSSTPFKIPNHTLILRVGRGLITLGLLSACALVSKGQVPAPTAQPYQPPVTILRDDISYDVEEDGTFINDESESVRLNTDQGVKTRSQLPISFSTSLLLWTSSKHIHSPKMARGSTSPPTKSSCSKAPRVRVRPLLMMRRSR